MPSTHAVKPAQKAVKRYYEALAAYAKQDVDHELAVRSAFQNLLEETGRRFGWTLIPELSDTAAGHRIQPDGTFRDDFHMKRGFWEAKDTQDKLEDEIRKKIKKGYPLTNTIFEDTQTAHLFQNGKQAMRALGQIDAMDRQIDQFVDDLYGLTDQEIAIAGEATR